MDIITPIERSQKLLCCSVINKKQEKSERFVELERFKLWSYMMFHKHGLRIGDLSLWLWLLEKDYLAREELYLRSPEIIKVNKLAVFLFDEKNGFSHVIHRFSRKSDTEILTNILISHIAEDIVASGNYEVTVHKGYCIKNETKPVDEIILGLSDKNERLWYRER